MYVNLSEIGGYGGPPPEKFWQNRYRIVLFWTILVEVSFYIDNKLPNTLPNREYFFLKCGHWNSVNVNKFITDLTINKGTAMSSTWLLTFFIFKEQRSFFLK